MKRALKAIGKYFLRLLGIIALCVLLIILGIFFPQHVSPTLNKLGSNKKTAKKSKAK